ncbi:MAG: ATP-binding protein [bacterium]
MKIRTKIVLIFISVFVLLTISSGIFVSIFTTSSIRSQVYSYLYTNVESRAEHIRTFLNDEKTTGVVLAGASVYRDFLKESKTSSQYASIKEKINQRIKRTLDADSSIVKVFIIDKKGVIVASSNSLEEGKDYSNDVYFTEGKEHVYIKDMYMSPELQKVIYGISAPVLDDTGALLGISVVEYDPIDFYTIVKAVNGLGPTEESFLINKDKYFLTPSLFYGDSVILKMKNDTKNASDCFDPAQTQYVINSGYAKLRSVLGNKVFVESTDYRGVNIVGTHAYIPETGWCLITKLDKADVIQNSDTISLIFFLIFGGSFIVFAISLIFISRKATKPIQDLSEAMKSDRDEYFNIELSMDRKDEIGDLYRSFNKMIGSVKKSREEIEQKVAEQTQTIIEKQKDLEEQKNALINVLDDSKILVNDLAKFKLAVDNASDLILITDPDGIVLYANKAIEIITGFKEKDTIGKKAGTLWRLPMSKPFYEELWKTIKTEKRTYQGEIKNRKKNHEIYDSKISISPVLDENNEIKFFVGIQTDITHEKEIDRAKTEFVSLASHQLRTPLTSIKWYTEMLLSGDGGEMTPAQKNFVNEISDSNQRMVQLVNALLNVSRLDMGTFAVDPEPLDIVQVAEVVIREQEHSINGKSQKFTFTHSDNIPTISADKNLVRIILQNLLSNANKYTPKEGSITLSIEKIENDPKPHLLIQCIDTGCGIPEPQKNKIFQKLFRADNARTIDTEGTGLGLYIIKSILDETGGSVKFESAEGKGTTFTISIPLSGMPKKDGSKGLT